MTFAVKNHVPECLVPLDVQARLPNPVSTALIESAAKRKEAEK